MRQLRIGLDIDETLFPFVEPLINYMHSIGINVPSYEHTNDFDLSISWGCSSEEVDRRLNLFLDSSEFAKLKPLQGVREAFDNLFPPHKGYPITARPTRVRQVTYQFFDEHLPGKVSTIYHLGSSNGEVHKVKKYPKAIALSLDLFVEDHVRHAREIASKGIPVLLMNRPWNVNEKMPELVTRVSDWREIVHYVREYASAKI